MAKYIRFLTAAEAADLPPEQAVMVAVAVDEHGQPVDIDGGGFSGSYNDLTDKPTIPEAYVLPAATASVLGGVKQAAATAAVSAEDAAAAGAEAVTKAEFDAVVALANANKAAINDVISKAKAAGQMA